MTQEEKQLLLKDLCARLLYGVIVNAQYKDGEGWKTEDRKILGLYEDGQVYLDCVYTTIDCIKPYLRPMSLMTDEERKGFSQLFYKWHDSELFDYIEEGVDFSIWKHKGMSASIFDWLNAHHFDYRGLIPIGLALEAPEGMYNTKTE